MILSVKHCGLMWGTRARGGEERRPGRDPLMKVIFCHAESESESRSVVSDSLRPYGLYSPWNSPGQNTGVGSLSLLQGIFPTQGLNPGLPHCRWILYQLSHKGSPLTCRSYIYEHTLISIHLYLYT